MWPGVHENWRIKGWFTSQYWRVENIGFIFLGAGGGRRRREVVGMGFRGKG